MPNKKLKVIKVPERQYRKWRRTEERVLKMKPLIRQLNRYIDRVK